MSIGYSKKLIMLDILEILRKNSDKDNPMKQYEIQKILETQYDIEVTRKTLGQYLSALRDAVEFRVHCKSEESDDAEDKNPPMTDFYYDHEFHSGELRLLIDSIMFTPALPKDDRKRLIEKIKNLSSSHFREVVKNSDQYVNNRIENPDMIRTAEILGKAIALDRQVSFQYCHCDTYFQLQINKLNNGSPKVYTVSPYQLVTANGHPYLVCNYTGYGDLSHFRLDRIRHIRLLEDSAVELRTLEEFKSWKSLAEYLTEHPNLWSGKSISVTFCCPKNIMNDVADWFGTKVNVFPKDNDMVEVQLKVSKDSMLHWALQYADCVEILKPEELREELEDILQNALKKYQKKS